MNDNTTLISKWQNKTWFGMATEIAAHAPFGKSSSALKKVETGLTIQLKV